LHDVSTYCMKFFKYDPSWDQIEGICHLQLENNLIEVKVQGAPDVLDSHFITTFNCNYKVVRGKCVAKALWNWKHNLQLVNQYNVSPIIIKQTSLKGLVIAKR
jgi:hypothetical protein